jgi:hypothetical protein
MSTRSATLLRPERSDGRGPVPRLRHLRVVGPHDRVRRAFRLTPRAGVTLTVLLFAALFAVAVSHALLIESQARLDRLDSQVAEEEARYERLRMEVAELESPDRIVADATALGMVAPEELVWITPDQAVPATDAATGTDPDASDTSWEDVKPYLGSTP